MITYNVKLNMSQEDSRNLMESLTIAKNAWNVISTERFTMTGGRLKPLHDKCYYKVKNLFPTLPSQFIIKMEQDVISTYKTIKSNKHKLESPATKKSLSIQLDKRIYKWIDKTNIKITTLNKQAICNFNEYDKLKELDFSKLKDPKLFYKNNQFYLSLIFDIKQEFIDNNSNSGGAGGSSTMGGGGGGPSGTGNSENGKSGRSYGGAGSGGSSYNTFNNTSGGSGAAGVVIFEW